ncbi:MULTISPECIES: hypothetical protein [Clostridium]|uniref:Uncharacterized protein n=1 Tax=Clostridium frigoriphilum TaxID=443253 RepID=A0ABU7UU91_9CLOT|nr:hypothetical protein [Clostridium sp. DSM 17811]MBU3101700.1 hypothetical protein [Clostridium sp. DSM 17811]
MNKVLVTGLGVGNDIGVCGACNLDFSWLRNSPSTLIWSDKIILTEGAWNFQKNKVTDKMDKATNLILEIAANEGIIEIINPKEIFNDVIPKEIIAEAEYDSDLLRERFPEFSNEENPSELTIKGRGYCIPYISAIYASMKIAEGINANCLFNRADYNYLYYKYGIATKLITNDDSIKCMEEVFKVIIPNELVFHNYAFVDDCKCNTCTNINSCSDIYLKEIEDNLYKILKWREYDEILRAKEEVQKIIDIKKKFGTDIDPLEVKREFYEKQKKINKLIKKVFPKMKRWTNLTTVLATPASLYSVSVANKPMAIISTGALGLSTMADQYLKYYENKNNWVGFINKINNI